MFISPLSIRKIIRTPKKINTNKTKKKPNSDDGEKGLPDEAKEIIHKNHRYVFFVIGMSTYPNTDTSLLTQKLFRCENFVNDCMMYHNICIALLSLTFTLVVSLDIKVLVCTVWASLFLHIFHVLIAIFGNGIHARNLFIFVFALMGVFRAALVFSTLVLLNNSRSAFSVISGLFQGILNNVVGYHTINDARINLIMCHSFQALVSLLAAVWITYVFLIYGNNSDSFKDGWGKNITDKISEIPKKLVNIKHYYTRFVLFYLVFVKYFFHTGLIPFLLELPVTSKLKGSVIYTMCELLGRSSGTLSDETIYPTHNFLDDHIFFIVRDIPLFAIIFLVIFLNSIILYSTSSGKMKISRSPYSIVLSMAFSGFFYGYIATRATRGSKAILDYKKTKQKTEPDGDEIPENTDGLVTEVQTMTYYCTLFIPYFFSRVTQLALSRSRLTIEYVLSRRYGNLTARDVSTMLSKLKSK